jgi:hypothetical protein
MSDTIKIEILRELAKSGAVREITLLGNGAVVNIIAKVGMGERLLVARSGRARQFRDLNRAARFIRNDLGLALAGLNLANWNPDQKAI